MTIPTGAAQIADAIRERVTPAFDTLDENVRQGRRFIERTEHAAEDAAGLAARRIRRRPLNAVAVAFGTGAVVGALIGVAVGWVANGRK